MDEILRNRDFMKCPVMDDEELQSDEYKKIPHPPLNKAATGEVIELPAFEGVVTRDAYTDLLDLRRSERVFSDTPLTGEQLAFLLWSAQGIQAFRGAHSQASLRPAPSGGARHPFEIYITVRNVEGLKPGLYHYLPLLHVGEKRVAVEYLGFIPDYGSRVTDMLAGQKWGSLGPVVLFFTCVAYRAEWRYREAAHRVMLIDLGHAGQNVMLSACALGLGSCCIAAFDTALCDEVLGVDGTDEYTVYAIPVGKVK